MCLTASSAVSTVTSRFKSSSLILCSSASMLVFIHSIIAFALTVLEAFSASFTLFSASSASCLRTLSLRSIARQSRAQCCAFFARNASTRAALEAAQRVQELPVARGARSCCVSSSTTWQTTTLRLPNHRIRQQSRQPDCAVQRYRAMKRRSIQSFSRHTQSPSMTKPLRVAMA